AYSGARRTRCGFLLDGDGRGKSFDDVHFGTLHLTEELAGVGREPLDIPALPLGINRVEGKRRLPRAGKTGDDRQRVARDFDADVFQVVLASAADDKFGQAHIARLPPQEPARRERRAPAPSSDTEARITFYNSSGVRGGSRKQAAAPVTL